VDYYIKLETLRLLCVRNNQQIIWCDIINGLYETMLSIETNSKDIGRKIALLTLFVG